MNAEETLERLRKRYDVNLPSGMNVTIRLPRIRDCIIAGQVPMPILEHIRKLAASNGDTPPLSSEMQMEDAAATARFHDELVRQTLVAIEGEPVEMTLEAVTELEQEDYDALVEYGSRAKSPLVASSA
jgi:hypothetical protein